MNPDGTFVYTPTGEYSGPDQFTYTVCDTGLPQACDIATVYLLVQPNPAIIITKASVLNDNGNGRVDVGDTITYNYVVTNTGNIALLNVSVTETAASFTGKGILPSPSFVNATTGSSSAILLTAGVATYKATYIITQLDIDAGKVDNQAIASGTDSFGTNAKNISDDPNNLTNVDTNGDGNPDDITKTILKQVPSIAITKDGTYNDTNADGITNVGDTITYKFVVTNTGNVTLTNITVTDNNATVTGGPLATLAVGVSNSTMFTAIHVITQADINSSFVYNLATAAGTPPVGSTVTATSTDPTPCATCPVNPSCATCTITPLVQNPKIAIIKTAEFMDDNGDGYAQAGETISYSFTVTNTGNVPLTDVTVTDTDLAGLILTGSPISLGVGASNSTAYSATYAITQADINLGHVDNQAMVTGTSPLNTIVTDLSDDTSNLDDKPTILPISGCVIEVFNAVSPNGDGDNDVFYIRGLECYPDNSVEIYNRWGVLVFERTAYNNDDRAFRGVSEGRVTVNQSEELPVGTYYYIFKYKDNESNGHEKAGYLYINR